jgi:hypothetical protein
MVASGEVDFDTLAEMFLSSNEFFGLASAGTQSAVLSQLDDIQALVASAADAGAVTGAPPDGSYLPAAGSAETAAPTVQVAGGEEAEFTP